MKLTLTMTKDEVHEAILSYIQEMMPEVKLDLAGEISFATFYDDRFVELDLKTADLPSPAELVTKEEITTDTAEQPSIHSVLSASTNSDDIFPS